MTHRRFTEVNHGGIYNSLTPVGAAKKAASQLFRQGKTGTLKISVRETTNGSLKKVFHYNVKREENNTVVLRSDGSSTVYRYKLVAKSKKAKK